MTKKQVCKCNIKTAVQASESKVYAHSNKAYNNANAWRKETRKTNVLQGKEHIKELNLEG